jgi:hypothetical protein
MRKIYFWAIVLFALASESYGSSDSDDDSSGERVSVAASKDAKQPLQEESNNITYHKFVSLSDVDAPQFGSDDLLLFGIDGIILDTHGEQQPPLGTFFDSLKGGDPICLSLRYNREHYTGKICDLITERSLPLTTVLDGVKGLPSMRIHDGAIYGHNFYGIRADIKAVIEMLSTKGRPIKRVVYFENDHQLIGTLKKSAVDFPLTIYYHMQPDSVSNHNLVEYTLIDEPALRWLLDEDLEAIARRIRADPLMLTRSFYKPFPDAGGLDLYAALKELKKYQAIPLAFQAVTADDHPLVQTIEFMLRQFELDCTFHYIHDWLLRLAPIYDPAIWDDMLAVVPKVVADDPYVPGYVEVFCMLSQLAKADSALLPMLRQQEPGEDKARMFASMTRELTPALSECLESVKPSTMQMADLCNVVRLCRQQSALSQNVSAALLRECMRFKTYLRLLESLRKNDWKSFQGKWTSAFRGIQPSLEAFLVESQQDQPQDVAKYVNGLFKADHDLCAALASERDIYITYGEFLPALVGTAGTLLEHSVICIVGLHAAGFLCKGREVCQQAEALVNAFKTCKSMDEQVIVDCLVRRSFNISQNPGERIICEIGHIPAAQRVVLNHIFYTYMQYDGKLGRYHPDDFESVLKKMSELTVEIITAILQGLKAEIEDKLAVIEPGVDDDKIDLDFHDVNAIIRQNTVGFQFKKLHW